MEQILMGIAMLLIAALLVWLGIRQRRRAYKGYEDDKLRYSASTAMKVVHIEKETMEHWEEREGGGQELMRDTVYIPTFEYTVNGQTYQYHSRQDLGGGRVGQLVTGYYDPANPKNITENRPRKPVLGGFFFFIGAAFLLLMAVMSFQGEVYWMF